MKQVRALILFLCLLLCALGCTNKKPCEGLAYEGTGNGCTISGIGTCTNTSIVISSERNGLPVTGLGNGAFGVCTGHTTIAFAGTSARGTRWIDKTDTWNSGVQAAEVVCTDSKVALE